MAAPERRIVERLERTGNDYAWIDHVTADFGDGRGPRDAYILGAPDGAFVLPIKDGKAILVRQERFTGHGWGYELPGGIVDEGEAPAVAACRELEEEAGYRAATLEPLTRARPHAAFPTLHHLFLATDLTAVGQRLEPSEEGMTVHAFTYDEILTMIVNGELIDSKTLVAVLLAKERGYFSARP